MLRLKRYDTIWLMIHQIRGIMIKRNEKYKLDGCTEFDEVFFERVDNKDIIKDESENNDSEIERGKRGYGNERQAIESV